MNFDRYSNGAGGGGGDADDPATRFQRLSMNQAQSRTGDVPAESIANNAATVFQLAGRANGKRRCTRRCSSSHRTADSSSSDCGVERTLVETTTEIVIRRYPAAPYGLASQLQNTADERNAERERDARFQRHRMEQPDAIAGNIAGQHGQLSTSRSSIAVTHPSQEWLALFPTTVSRFGHRFARTDYPRTIGLTRHGCTSPQV